LLARRWRQAGIVRGFAGLGEPCLKFGNALLGRSKALPQRPDQGVFLGVAQGVKVGKLRHPAARLDSAVTASSTFFQAGRCLGRSSRQMTPEWGMSSYNREAERRKRVADDCACTILIKPFAGD